MMNSRKKYIACLITAATLSMVATSSFAANSSGVSGSISIDDAASGQSLTVDLSPGVVMSYATTTNEFALATANQNATDDFRLEYGIYSQVTGYYQRANTSTADPIVLNYAPTADLTAGSNPFTTDWVYMGNVD